MIWILLLSTNAAFMIMGPGCVLLQQDLLLRQLEAACGYRHSNCGFHKSFNMPGTLKPVEGQVKRLLSQMRKPFCTLQKSECLSTRHLAKWCLARDNSTLARDFRLPKHGLPRANKKLSHKMTEFFMRRVVETMGFEPTTPCMRSRCSPAELRPH